MQHVNMQLGSVQRTSCSGKLLHPAAVQPRRPCRALLMLSREDNPCFKRFQSASKHTGEKSDCKATPISLRSSSDQAEESCSSDWA